MGPCYRIHWDSSYLGDARRKLTTICQPICKILKQRWASEKALTGLFAQIVSTVGMELALIPGILFLLKTDMLSNSIRESARSLGSLSYLLLKGTGVVKERVNGLVNIIVV